MKRLIKWILTQLNCLIYGVKYQKGIYIGLGCKVVGSQRVTICGGG